MDEDWLSDWRESDRRMVSASGDPTVSRLLKAVAGGERITIVYHGGADPGGRRTIRPREVFRVSGYGATYVSAYCETRGEARTFRVDRIEIAGIARSPRPASTGHTTRTGAGYSSSDYEPRYSSEVRRAAPQQTGCLVSLAILVLQALVILLVVVIALDTVGATK